MTKTEIQDIDFEELQGNLKTLMDEIDIRLQSKYDAFGPHMWGRLQLTVSSVILEMKAVRMCLNGMSTQEVAEKLGIKKMRVAAMLACNTMWQNDYANPDQIAGSVSCDFCQAPIGTRCMIGLYSSVHDSRREAYRKVCGERALTTWEIRKKQKNPPAEI